MPTNPSKTKNHKPRCVNVQWPWSIGSALKNMPLMTMTLSVPLFGDKKPGGEELSTGPKRRGRDAAASKRGAVVKVEKILLSLKKVPGQAALRELKRKA